MTTKYKTIVFVVAVLYSIDEKWRGIRFSQSFEDILKNRSGVNLQAAWQSLKEEGFLCQFADDFKFDFLHGRSNLGEIVAEAYLPYSLIRLDSTNFAYHLDFITERTINVLLEKEKFPIEIIRVIATRLNKILEEQEKYAISSAA